MSNRSYFFSWTEKLAKFVAKKFHERKWDLNRLCYYNLLLGVLSPLPLIFHIYLPSSLLMIFSPIFLCLYVFIDYAISHLELLARSRSPLNSLVPFPITIFIFLWYEIVLCEVTYAYANISLLRYYHVFALCCAVAGLLLIYGYLKLKNEPLNIHRFAEQLQRFGEESESVAPLNYITVTFKVLKQDLFASVLLLLSLLNLYLLYFIMTLASIGFFAFTLYSLILLKMINKPAVPDDIALATGEDEENLGV